MIEETKTVFDKLNESMATIAEELNNSNTLFYSIVATLLELTDKLNALNAKLDQVLSKPVKVTLDEGTVPAPKEPEENTAVKYAYSSKQAIKKEVTG